MIQYQPLYLKYRPQKLSGLVGQEVVSKTLSNAIKYNKIVHAYLFCGPRGTGKTSTARILAKSLNCEKGITVDPCDRCTNCLSIINGNSLDVIEIDAASHRKVEDAEDLINRVSLGTYGSRYKIYIIDEVHMLTDHAFNALLKTLEEPPKNVIFILATTEEHKILPTIISRCQKLDFKPVQANLIDKRILEIAKEEKINIDDSVTLFISKRSNGCLRDAVSLLDQISVLQEGDNKINPKEVYMLFGAVDRSLLFDLLKLLLKFDRKDAIDLGEELLKSGKDIGELLKSLIELVIDFAKAKLDAEYKKELNKELNNKLNFLEEINHSHLLKMLDRLHDTQAKLRYAISPELHFMSSIMSMLDEDFLISFSELNEKVRKLEHFMNKDTKHKPKEISKSNEIDSLKEPKIELDTDPVQSDYLPNDLDNIWNKVLGFINSNPTKTLLIQSGCYLLILEDDFAEIGISKDMFLPRLKNDVKKKEMILNAIKLATEKTPKELRFRFQPKVIKESSMINQELTIKETEVVLKKEFQDQSPDDSELSRAIVDLLGAKPVD